jgi:hypothetical protein
MAQSKVHTRKNKAGLTFIYRNKNVAIWTKGYRGYVFAIFKGEREGLVTIPKKKSNCKGNVQREPFE